jgi:hypothetical protein
MIIDDYVGDEFDALQLMQDAEALMNHVNLMRFEGADFSAAKRGTFGRQKDAHLALLKRRDTVLASAQALLEECEQSIAAKRERLDAALSDQTRRSSEGSLEWLADQIERVEHARVRVSTAINMLRLID